MINSDSYKFDILNLIGIIICIITISSVFQFSTYTLENNIKENHTYILKGRVNQINYNSVRIENTDYNVDFKYMNTPFVLSDLVENNKVEVVIADGVFSSYV